MKYLLAFALLFFTAQNLAAEPSSPSVQWQQTGSKNYEPEHPGLGVSFRYSAPVGWVDVYVYSLGFSNWDAGVADPKFAEHFQSTLSDVRYYAQAGAYRDLEIGEVREILIAEQLFRAVNLRYELQGKTMDSGIFLTARNGQLMKYRISVFTAAGLNFETTARQFIEENLRDDPSAKRPSPPGRIGL